MTLSVLYIVIICVSLCLSGFEACLPSGKHNHVTIGSDTYVCVTLGPLIWNTTGEYLRVALKVQADQLSSIKVPQSWTSNIYKNDTTMQRLSILDQTEPGAGLGISVSSMGVLSYQRVYRQVLKYSIPTSPPTQLPSTEPSTSPSQSPTEFPTTTGPSESPTLEPTSLYPTQSPTTAVPTFSMVPTEDPTLNPSVLPTVEPSLLPTRLPTTTVPTTEPTTFVPTQAPSVLPSAGPTTTQPSQAPTVVPTTASPSVGPSAVPTTSTPSVEPSQAPSTGSRRVLRSAWEEHAVQFGLEEVTPDDVAGNSTTNGTTIVEDTGPFATKSVTFPMLMAIIYVDGGKVKSVVWDDFCNWCSSSRCAANTVDYNENIVSGEGHNCYVSDNSCVLPAETVTSGNSTVTTSSTNLCELNVYITWHGTDSAGAHFQSAASRFSRLSVDQMKNVTGTLQEQRATY